MTTEKHQKDEISATQHNKIPGHRDNDSSSKNILGLHHTAGDKKTLWYYIMGYGLCKGSGYLFSCRFLPTLDQ